MKTIHILRRPDTEGINYAVYSEGKFSFWFDENPETSLLEELTDLARIYDSLEEILENNEAIIIKTYNDQTHPELFI